MPKLHKQDPSASGSGSTGPDPTAGPNPKLPPVSASSLIRPHSAKANPVPLHFPECVDNTMLSAFDSCPQKFFNEFILGLSGHSKSPDLHAGGCFATAMEVVRRGVYRDGLSMEHALAEAWTAFVRQWGDYEPPENNNKTAENMFNAVVLYFREYPPETDVVQPLILDNGEPAIEFTFAMPTHIKHPDTGDPVLYGGRFDMLGKAFDQLAVVDEKTTKSLGPYWMKSWGMRGQFLGYIHAARQFNFPASHALVRGIGILKTEIKFAQVFEQYPEFLIERWWDNVHRKLGQMVHYYEEMSTATTYAAAHHAFPMSFGDGCSSYGGCMFEGLCRTNERENWYSNFGNRVWDPLRKDPSEGSDANVVHLDPVAIDPREFQ